MLNVIADYLEAEGEEERARQYARCSAIGKKYAKNLEMWINKSNREAAFRGTPRVTRGPQDRRVGSAGVAGGQGLARVADALEELVGLKRYELGLANVADDAGLGSPPGQHGHGQHHQ